MYFILSKLLVIFIQPLSWILILSIIALIVKNNKRKIQLFVTSFLLLVIFTNPFLLDTVAKHWDVPPVDMATLPKSSCVIILGGFASEGRNAEGYFNSSSDRFIEGLKLKVAGYADNILITGGNSSLIPTGFREANWVKDQLKVFKVPDSCVLIDDLARNSIENAISSKRFLDSLHLPPPYILVTSAFHMRRSLYTFQQQGLQVVAYPSNYIAGKQRFTINQFLPEAGIIGGWGFYIKEIIGYYSYKLKKGKGYK